MLFGIDRPRPARRARYPARNKRHRGGHVTPLSPDPKEKDKADGGGGVSSFPFHPLNFPVTRGRRESRYGGGGRKRLWGRNFVGRRTIPVRCVISRMCPGVSG
ncbi:hypothetical protein CEXT_347991 [Caerostris extrusa]|uniref:Uncharacterized protein n=1 Tax=Caerostris extrusa TaxID=172846 RepID=A0AAV4S0J3_CAEEX|nr:hypothetical protein CEXT_347991 [Caerostris extrusa]